MGECVRTLRLEGSASLRGNQFAECPIRVHAESKGDP